MINEVFDDSSVTEIEKVFNRVHEQPIYTQKKVFKFEGVGWDYDQIVDSHKAICNPDGDVIAVVGKGYKLIQNADILPEYEKAIYRSGLDTTGMKRDIKQSHFGARTVCTYTFPAHKVEVRSGDFIALQISVLNSYDGSWKFMSLLGALRYACSNGLVIGGLFSFFYGKHTKSLDTDIAIKKLEKSLDIYMRNAQLWEQYPFIPVSELQAYDVFLNLAGESKALLELLQDTHALYIDAMGNNLWALFNTLTDWSSHAKFKNKSNIAATVITREQKVRKVLPMLTAISRAA